MHVITSVARGIPRVVITSEARDLLVLVFGAGRKSRSLAALVMTAIGTPLALFAQQGFTDAFPPEEFAARRAKVVAEIGDGVAIMQGTTERRGESPLRQSNQFFYLTGVTEPRAFLIVDGRTKQSTLYIAPGTPQR